MPVADKFVKELNRLVYKFVWNGTDKATRFSTINDYAKGGLKMIDIDFMINLCVWPDYKGYKMLRKAGGNCTPLTF